MPTNYAISTHRIDRFASAKKIRSIQGVSDTVECGGNLEMKMLKEKESKS